MTAGCGRYTGPASLKGMETRGGTVNEIRKTLEALSRGERRAVVAELIERGEVAVAREVAQVAKAIPVR